MFVNKPSYSRALIVDDETDICYLLSNILRQKKIQARHVSSLSEAAKVLQSDTNFSIIFLDNYLPDGLGSDFIDTIKKKNPSAKLVMISAHDSYSDRKKALQSGADSFMSKPFSKELVLKEIDHISIN